MKIGKSVYRISEKTDISTELQLSIKNSYQHDIAYVRTSVVFVDDHGRLLGADSSYSDEVIEEGGKGKVYVGPWMQRQAKAFQAGTVHARVAATLCRKARLRVGEVPVPAENDTTMIVGEPRDLEGVKLIGLRVARWTEDGELRLEINGAVENTSDKFIDRCVLRVALLDSDESVVEETSADELVRPKLSQPLTASFYSLKKGQLKNATLRVFLEVYVGIATETAEAEVEFRKDDDYDDDDDEDDDE